MKPNEAIQKIVKEHMFQNVPTFFMLVGAPGSGKSTFIKKLNDALKPFGDLLVASTDDLIEAEAAKMGLTYSQAFDKLNQKKLKHQMEESVERAVQLSRPIAWDQTNMGRKSRMSKLKLIPEVYHKICLNFTVNDKLLQERLKKRADETGKIIPPFVMKNMFNSYDPPSRSEGFNFIFEINND